MPPEGGNPIDIDSVRSHALVCTKCGLAEGRTQVVWADGDLDSDVVFIGEAPGFHEDQQGKPFVGAAGQLLDTLLGEIGLDRTKVAIVNVLKCRPPGNRDPLPDEIETCRPWLEAQLSYMSPKVIVTLGNFATRFILEEPIGISRARGRKYRRRGATVVPTFHPAAALRGGRFGQTSPIDAIREDLLLVQSVLEAPDVAEPADAPADAPAGVPEPAGHQLGLF
ncbi:MAG: uracil-DNA glycosylase [Actinomycetota bacterium]